MTEEEKLLNGLLYSPKDPQLKAIKLRTHNLNVEYNNTKEDETEKRTAILNAIFAQLGEGCFFQGPIYIHYGSHTKIGKGLFANFNLTIQDDTWVEIGDYCNFGPNVTIVTPQHPIIPEERFMLDTPAGPQRGLCYAQPVKIGSHCWFGAGVTVCPGVTIGDGAVIGAGSVVTKDIPPRTIAAGVPCRVLREISDADSMRNHPELFAGYAAE